MVDLLGQKVIHPTLAGNPRIPRVFYVQKKSRQFLFDGLVLHRFPLEGMPHRMIVGISGGVKQSFFISDFFMEG